MSRKDQRYKRVLWRLDTTPGGKDRRGRAENLSLKECVLTHVPSALDGNSIKFRKLYYHKLGVRTDEFGNRKDL